MKLRNRRKLHGPKFFVADTSSTRRENSKSPVAKASKNSILGRSSKRLQPESPKTSSVGIGRSAHRLVGRSPITQSKSKRGRKPRNEPINRRKPIRKYKKREEEHEDDADGEEESQEESEDNETEEGDDDHEKDPNEPWNDSIKIPKSIAIYKKVTYEQHNEEQQKSFESMAAHQSIDKIDNSASESATAPRRSGGQFEALLRRKVTLGICSSSGEFIKPPAVPIDTTTIPSNPRVLPAFIISQPKINESPPTAITIPLAPIRDRDVSITPPVIINESITNRPNVNQSITSRAKINESSILPNSNFIDASIPSQAAQVKGHTASIRAPTGQDQVIPVSCPVCCELFTTADNATQFEDHIRAYHPRFWMSQTGNQLVTTPIMVPARAQKRKREEEDTDEPYKPQGDSIVNGCVSCRCRGIKCGFGGFVHNNANKVMPAKGC